MRLESHAIPSAEEDLYSKSWKDGIEDKLFIQEIYGYGKRISGLNFEIFYGTLKARGTFMVGPSTFLRTYTEASRYSVIMWELD